jgi:hypothetical protein
MFGLKVGDRVILPDGEWPIVGAFSTGGGILESELVSDAATVMASARSNNFNSALVRLESPSAFNEFEHWVMDNPALTVTAERQVDFYVHTAAPFMAFFTSLAFFVGTVLAIGALPLDSRGPLQSASSAHCFPRSARCVCRLLKACGKPRCTDRATNLQLSPQ